MTKAIKGAVRIIGAVASVVALIPSPLQPIAAAVAGASAFASTALEIISPTKPNSSLAGTQTSFTLDPNAGIPYCIGRSFYAGAIVHRDTWGSDNEHQGMAIEYSLGPIDRIERFTSDQTTINFDSNGNAIGSFRDYMRFRVQLGATPSPALTSPLSGFPGITANTKYSGHCVGHLVLSLDTKDGQKFAAGVPRSGLVMFGPKVYDPRQDGTYTGGSGQCRALQEDSYVGAPYNENMWLQALTLALGRWHNGKRVFGVGAPLENINIQSFVDCANIADANGWKAGGMITSTDDKWEVLKMLAQAGGGQIFRVGGVITAFCESPKISVVTIREQHLIGKASVAAAQLQRDKLNRVVPIFRSEAHGWEQIPANAVEVPEYIEADGREITGETEFVLVQQGDQAAELALYEIFNSREIGPIDLPVMIQFLGVEPGDQVDIDIPALALNNLTAVILTRQMDPTTAAVQLSCRSETTEKHAFVLGQSATLPPVPNLSGPDLSIIPIPGANAWNVTADLITQGNISKPILRLRGAVDLPTATGLVVEYRPLTDPASDWVFHSMQSQNLESLEISGVTPETLYQVAISNVRNGLKGPRRNLTPAGIETGKEAGPPVAWDNVNDKPVELTDGRLLNGLQPDGSIKVLIPPDIRIGSDLLGRIGGGLYIGDLEADITGQNTALNIVGQGSGATAPDSEVLNRFTDRVVNLVAVGTGKVEGNSVSKTGSFGLNGGAYSLEASTSFYASCFYDFGTLTGAADFGLSDEPTPDGTDRDDFICRAELVGSISTVRFRVDEALVASFSVSAGQIPTSGLITMVYEGQKCSFFVNGILLAERLSKDVNVLARVLIMPVFGGVISKLDSVSYGPANNTLWDAIADSENKPADRATANIVLKTFGPRASNVIITGNQISATASDTRSGVITTVARANSCLFELTLNGQNSAYAALFDEDVDNYTEPPQRFAPSRLHLDIQTPVNNVYQINVRYTNPAGTFVFNRGLSAATGQKIGLAYDGNEYFVLVDGYYQRNGAIVGLRLPAQSGYNMRAWLAFNGIPAAGHFPFIDIDWLPFTDNGLASLGGLGLTETEIRNPFLTGDGFLTVTPPGGSPVNLGAVSLNGLGAGAVATLDLIGEQHAANELKNSQLFGAIENAASTAQYGSVAGAPQSLDDLDEDAGIKLAEIQEKADVTSQSVPYHEGISSITVNANHLSEPDQGQIPRNFIYKRFRGNINVSNQAVWSIENPVNLTATISGGAVSISNITGSGSLIVRSILDGVTLDSQISTTLSRSPAPQGGSSGGLETTVTTNNFIGRSSTTLSVISQEMRVKTGNNGTIQFSAPLDFTTMDQDPDGAWGSRMQWQYKPIGGNWTNIAAAVTEQSLTTTFFESELNGGFYYSENGSINCSPLLQGLAVNMEFDVRLLGSRNGGPVKTIFWSGQASAAGG